MPKNPLKRNAAIAGVATVIISLLFWSLHKQNASKQNFTANPVVKTTPAKEAEKNTALEISGFVRGANRADIAPMTSGRILRILKHEGEPVKRGDALAIIEADQSDAQVAAAQASVTALEKTLNDSKKYYDQLVDQAKEAPNSDATDEAVKSAKRGRDLQIQAAQDQLVAAQGSLGVAQAGKNNATLIAPFSGTITTVYGREGGFANFSMPLISVSTQNSLEIETYVSATDGRNISVGSIATLQAPNNAPISGIVTAVSPGGDSLSLKTLVRIRINDSSDNIRLGDFLRGEILVPRAQEAVLIPRNAIVSRGGDPIVFTLDENNIVHEHIISINGEHDGLADVIQGINADQNIVTEGQQFLINGITVTPYDTK